MRAFDRRELLAGGASMFAALYLYTQPLYRPRHVAVVRQALQRRAATHTSGWQQGRDGKPLLEVGPVASGAAHWHRETFVKPISRAWPYVIVLEYDGAGAPQAYIDCFRRALHSQLPGAWMLDPNEGYVEHINAEMVASQDERWCYLAAADTPTGSVVVEQEFAIRGRVRWADGRRTQKGWWLTFEAPLHKSVEGWHAERIPLVDWRVTRTTPSLGIVATARVDDPDRELAVWATPDVFRFPDMPGGLQPGRGRR